MKKWIVVLAFATLVLPLTAKEYRVQDLDPTVIQHRKEAKQGGNVAIIVAEGRNGKESGQLAAKLMEKAGFAVKALTLVPKKEVATTLTKMAEDPSLISILCIGGTGFSPTDTTVDAIKSLPGSKDLPGYGELLRRLTDERWENVTTQAGYLSIHTRATAVAFDNKIIFAVPGSKDGTQLAVEAIIIPALPFLMEEFQRKT